MISSQKHFISRTIFHQQASFSFLNNRKKESKPALTVCCWCWYQLKSIPMLSRFPCEPSSVSGVPMLPPLFFLSLFLNRLNVEEKTPLRFLESGLLPGDFSPELGRSRLLDLLRRLSAVSFSRLARLVRRELVVGDSWLCMLAPSARPFCHRTR